METIQGRLDFVRYQGDNFWTVAELRCNGACVTIVGNLIDAEIGDSLKLTGQWQKHERFGKQFKFTSCETVVPTSDEGVVGFLESRLYGVGRARAIEMVRRFGADKVFDVISNNPERLQEITGITAARAEQIRQDYLHTKSVRDTVVFLKQFQLTDNQVGKIIEKYKDKTCEIIKNNPYQLIQDIDGFGFKTVDTFAIRMGVDRNGIERAKAGCVYVLHVAQNEGNSYIPYNEYVTKVVKELSVPKQGIEKAIKELHEVKTIIVDENRVYGKYMHALECRVASLLSELTWN